MGNFQSTDTQVLLCDCHSDDHQILVHYDEDDGDVYLHIHLATRGFLRRLMYAIKYVFGYKSRFGAWDEFVFRKQDAEKLRQIARFVDGESMRNGFLRTECDELLEFHPFTCDRSGGEKCERENGTGEGEMKARDGWFQCPCGVYKQHKL